MFASQSPFPCTDRARGLPGGVADECANSNIQSAFIVGHRITQTSVGYQGKPCSTRISRDDRPVRWPFCAICGRLCCERTKRGSRAHDVHSNIGLFSCALKGRLEHWEIVRKVGRERSHRAQGLAKWDTSRRNSYAVGKFVEIRRRTSIDSRTAAKNEPILSFTFLISFDLD